MSRRLFALVAVMSFAVVAIALTGCTTVKQQPTTTSEAPIAPTPPPTPTPMPTMETPAAASEFKPVEVTLRMHPPYGKMTQDNYDSATELAEELREKFNFGVTFANDGLTKQFRSNLGLVASDGKTYRIIDWPHQVHLNGQPVYLFRCRAFYFGGYIHWADAAQPRVGMDQQTLAGTITRWQAKPAREPDWYPYDWHVDEVGFDYRNEPNDAEVKTKVYLVAGQEVNRIPVGKIPEVDWPFEPDQATNSMFEMPNSFWHKTPGTAATETPRNTIEPDTLKQLNAKSDVQLELPGGHHKVALERFTAWSLEEATFAVRVANEEASGLTPKKSTVTIRIADIPYSGVIDAIQHDDESGRTVVLSIKLKIAG